MDKIKLSFSTLGCPEWSFADIISTARDLGYQGVEIRGVMREMFAPKMKIFDAENIEKTKKTLADTGIQIPILTTGAYLSDTSQVPLAEMEVLAYAQLAQKLGVKYLRVMGEKTPEPSGEGRVGEIAEQYAKLCELVKNTGVTLLIETNGILADSVAMKKLMESVPAKNKGVLWDIHHTYRYFNEDVDTTVSNIGKYIKHVHIKDSVMNGDKIKYVLTGYGDMPIAEAIKALCDIGYDGYYSYEWVKRWVPEIEGSGIAFHRYSSYLNSIKL